MDAPTADELRVHPVVVAAFAAAWADSFPDDRVLRHEEGGYIYFNPTTGEVLVRRALPGTWGSLNLNNPPVVRDAFLVATYHTHPHPISEGFDPDPSSSDIYWADDSGVPWLIVSELGVVFVGPSRRSGGLVGNPGYPK
jgi:hypothetical protein